MKNELKANFKLQKNIFFIVIIPLFTCNYCLGWRDLSTKLNNNKRQKLSDESNNKSIIHLQDRLEQILMQGRNSEDDTELDSWSFYDNPELGNLIEGDLVEKNSKNGVRRVFMSEAGVWFEGLVPIYFSPLILGNVHAYNTLLNSMKTIQLATDYCILFRPINEWDIASYPTLPYVNVTGHAPGCFSSIGRALEQIETQLNLNVDQCFNIPGNSLHELLHVLGQIHEHMRPDRDKYIDIVWENIPETKRHNFKLFADEEVPTIHYPYDFESVMHYPRTAFTISPGFATVIPKKSYGNVEIGQRTHLSQIDVAKLRSAYNCQQSQADYTLAELADIYTNKTIFLRTIVEAMDAIRKNNLLPKKIETGNSITQNELSPKTEVNANIKTIPMWWGTEYIYGKNNEDFKDRNEFNFDTNEKPGMNAKKISPFTQEYIGDKDNENFKDRNEFNTDTKEKPSMNTRNISPFIAENHVLDKPCPLNFFIYNFFNYNIHLLPNQPYMDQQSKLPISQNNKIHPSVSLIQNLPYKTQENPYNVSPWPYQYPLNDMNNYRQPSQIQDTTNNPLLDRLLSFKKTMQSQYYNLPN